MRVGIVLLCGLIACASPLMEPDRDGDPSELVSGAAMEQTVEASDMAASPAQVPAPEEALSEVAPESGPINEPAIEPAPEPLSLELLAPARSNATSVPVSFSCMNADACTFTCAINGGQPAACSSPFELVTSSEGSYTVDLSATDATGRTGVSSATVTIERQAPTLTSVAFVAYDELRLTFDEAIDPSSLDASDFSIDQKPTGMRVLGVSASGETVAVLLSRLHLPWSGYAISYSVRDLAGNVRAASHESLTGVVHARLTFASATGVDGAITLPQEVSATCPSAASGIDRADCLCQYEASQAGMLGTFRAILSDANHDAYCRMAGLSGKVADTCGAATLPSLGPWVRADGLAVSNQMDPQAPVGTFFAHPALGLDGTTTPSALWSGTTSTFQARTPNCSDWSTPSGTVFGYSAPLPAEQIPWTFGAVTQKCQELAAIQCVQADGGGLPTKPIRDIPAGAQRLFVSSTRSDGDLGGTSGADGTCRSLAAAAGLESPERFTALLSDSQDDAYCRILGLQGKRSANCGQAGLPPGSGPVVSLYGHPLAENVAAFFTDGPSQPFFGSDDGIGRFRGIKSGSTSAGLAPDTRQCQDWSSSDGSMQVWVGDTSKAGAAWINAGWNYCSVDHSIACIERP